MERQKFIILLASTVIAAFLGAFVASVFVNGGHRRHYNQFDVTPLPPVDFANVMQQHQKMMDQQEKFFDKMNDDIEDSIEKTSGYSSFGFMSNAGVNVQETKDLYKIIIDLKPFNNDTNNVDVKINGHNAVISAKYKSKDKNDYRSSEVYQSLTLPSKIDLKSIKKQKEGNSLVISIPKK